jgi:hypothetical membrane protein
MVYSLHLSVFIWFHLLMTMCLVLLSVTCVFCSDESFVKLTLPLNVSALSSFALWYVISPTI